MKEMYDKTKYTAHLIILHKGDYSRLSRLYSTKKPGVVIRELVHEKIREIELAHDSVLKEIVNA